MVGRVVQKVGGLRRFLAGTDGSVHEAMEARMKKKREEEEKEREAHGGHGGAAARALNSV